MAPRTALILSIAVITAGYSAFGAEVEEPQVSPATTRPKEVWAVRVERPPRLDGTLDDPLWLAAQPVADFRQRQPYKGTEPTERTEVRVLYDTRHVYFGVFCYDSDSQGIIATQLRRDLEMYLGDDFQILIDPTFSRRNAYVFEVNPLGTQRDGSITEEERPSSESRFLEYNPNWDGLWVSAAH